MEASMPSSDFHPFFWILCGNRSFSFGFDPEKLENVKIHVHDKMPRSDNTTFDKFDKIT
jgi:hypothetical protein